MANSEGLARSTHLTAKEYEERRPHSGPVAVQVGILDGAPVAAVITTVIEADESVVKTPAPALGMEVDPFEELWSKIPQRKSLREMDLRLEDRARRKSVYGGWYRDEASGKWTRERSERTRT